MAQVDAAMLNGISYYLQNCLLVTIQRAAIIVTTIGD